MLIFNRHKLLCKKLVLINVSNLHIGGGVQVAISFLSELSMMDKYDFSDYHVVASSEVDEGLIRLDINMSVFGNYEVINTYGTKAYFSPLNRKIKNYNTVFTVFGPNYLRAKSRNEIVGFAQFWMLQFKNPITYNMSFSDRNFLRLKFFIQWIFFLRSDHYIVELEHVKKGLIEKKGINKKDISIAYNTVSSLYKDKIKWQKININKSENEISLGIVARDYSHKNLNVLPFVAKALKSRHGLDVYFYTTLNDTEWATKDAFFKKYVFTLGSLLPEQCPSFYEQIDGVVFPSLLECFSATPLEAMVMNKPLFASDRGFVRDVCGSHAVYFDPLDADDIADKIASYFTLDLDYTQQLQQAKDHALNFSSAKGRAEKYLKIIQQHLEG